MGDWTVLALVVGVALLYLGSRIRSRSARSRSGRGGAPGE
jgi:hypothetical protein